jgi:hypothetical protein
MMVVLIVLQFYQYCYANTMYLHFKGCYTVRFLGHLGLFCHVTISCTIPDKLIFSDYCIIHRYI